jgi:hypothetical protein
MAADPEQPAARLVPQQYGTALWNPVIRVPLAKTDTVPNTLFPRPPDYLLHFVGEAETYFHLPANAELKVAFSRVNAIRSSLLKIAFTIEL